MPELLWAKINLDRIDEVKVVYVGQDVSAYLDLSASHYFLQPCSCANTEGDKLYNTACRFFIPTESIFILRISLPAKRTIFQWSETGTLLK